jgi:hypothetical protein
MRNHVKTRECKNYNVQVVIYATCVQSTIFYKWEVYTHEGSQRCRPTPKKMVDTQLPRIICCLGKIKYIFLLLNMLMQL